ncbi:putative methylesterase 14, chloroplastic [Phalaenopsis equestris]|uniref:putative methylesterase 14, chloroplastic n=1 Tax=Phalaenopsis equestris TaxID=78828 RepID=UPI0009E3C586|nr:putative methylesterase 14, chloroplastic [Phalaenopsis equestris]XP_020598959.1 putative methylesterase 14, chloroplastic [Phalaenopsis equestris]XP_020598961.1 putative methylesterase 14, chloroplastic [Phalaenopsis equestris]XP_020598962.1 putative methylesterase 14, chloroplastic [Phalaenopsis equestris]XP_020598963.1 putative methylesterase 14, chloroplastic [Phalaenopsis equestris]
MGNGLGCIPGTQPNGGVGSRSKSNSRSQRKTITEEDLLHRQALAMAIQQHQLSQRFDGSMSRRIGSTSSRKQTPSSSFRKPVPIVLDSLETKKIILVHGEGFGAWCWYKIIPLLEEAGLHPVALDLMGSGIDHTDVNSILTLADYTKPLLDYLHNLHEDEKVILVGHSCGGACVSYALECFPKKVTKAVFLGATMVCDGQRPFDVFAEELASAEVFLQESQLLLYANGNDKPPTGLMLDKEKLKGLYFNQSPSKDIALASVSMRPIPLAPIMENLSLTVENYGSVRRYFIQMLDDRVLSSYIQEKLVRENPPQEVFKLRGSDHCPFFSKPQSLCKILLEIVQLI